MTARPCVFLDRDGTLHTDVDFLRDPAELQIYPGVGSALLDLQSAGFALVVVTNQSGIARGYLSEERLGEIHAALSAKFDEVGVSFDGIYYSPYHPTEGDGRYRRESDCRKPQPGMLLRARDELELDLGESWIIGDSERDLEAGRRAGVRGILVATGKGAQEHERLLQERREHVFVPDFSAAADYVLAHGGPSRGTPGVQGK